MNASFEVWRGGVPPSRVRPDFPPDLKFSHGWLHTTIGFQGSLGGDIRWWDITKGRKLNCCLLNVDDNLCKWLPSNLGQSLSTLCFLFTGCCRNWKICWWFSIMTYALKVAAMFRWSPLEMLITSNIFLAPWTNFPIFLIENSVYAENLLLQQNWHAASYEDFAKICPTIPLLPNRCILHGRD